MHVGWKGGPERPAGRLWGSGGNFHFLFPGLVCPRPPPPTAGVRAGPLVALFVPMSWRFRGVASLFRTLSSLHTRVGLVVMDTGHLRGCKDAQRPSLRGEVGLGGSRAPTPEAREGWMMLPQPPPEPQTLTQWIWLLGKWDPQRLQSLPGAAEEDVFPVRTTPRSSCVFL